MNLIDVLKEMNTGATLHYLPVTRKYIAVRNARTVMADIEPSIVSRMLEMKLIEQAPGQSAAVYRRKVGVQS